jgi:bifunctional DNase/RNase
MLVAMDVVSFGVDPSRNTPILLLKEIGGQRMLAVPIGPFEASALAMTTLGVSVDKPLAIDLAKLLMDSLGGTLERVVIGDGAEPESLLARMHVRSSRGLALVDCVPSHGIVLAIRCAAPLLVFEHVLEKRQGADSVSPAEMLRRHISSLDTIDFGCYHME